MRTAKTGRMPRLIWVFAGRTVILLVLSRGGTTVNCHSNQSSYPIGTKHNYSSPLPIDNICKIRTDDRCLPILYKLCWHLIFTVRIFHTCELFARIQRVKNSHEFVTDFERICHTRVTYTFHTSFIGSINANSSHSQNTPKEGAFLYIRIFYMYFIIFLITLWIENFSMWYYMLEFPGQVLELSMSVGRGTKGAPRPPVGLGMDG